LRGSLKFALSALAAGTVGLASVTAAIDGSIGGISESLGQWKIWPLAGAAAADPYTRAHFIAGDRLPPNSFEVQEYETSVDSEGRSLDASCTYRLSGRMPPTRWWSVWAMVPGASADQQPGGVTSNDVVYDANSEVMIALSASPQTGQWVHLTDSGSFTVIMRLYNPAVNFRRNVKQEPLPVLARANC
jgi:hypothetical protein